jgi:hypothetical protein
MPKYEVIESKLNARKDKRQIRVIVSPEETIFLNMPAEPSPERVDAAVDLFLANRELAAAQEKVEVARRATNID